LCRNTLHMVYACCAGKCTSTSFVITTKLVRGIAFESRVDFLSVTLISNTSVSHRFRIFTHWSLITWLRASTTRKLSNYIQTRSSLSARPRLVQMQLSPVVFHHAREAFRNQVLVASVDNSSLTCVWLRQCFREVPPKKRHSEF
jgi:hypothetical protein